MSLLNTSVFLLNFQFWWRQYQSDLVTLASAIVGYIVAAWLVESPRLLFGVSIGITIVATAVIMAIKSRERDFIWLSMRGRLHGDGWIGAGGLSFARTEEAYRITQSFDGAILQDTLTWSDYRVRFAFRIDKLSLGVILRAANMGNLVMLQIFQDRIKAHIRVNGVYMSWDYESSLTFGARLSLGTWYECDICCDKREVRIIISGPNRSENTLSWKIPSGSLMLRAGSPEVTGTFPVPFMVNYDYGAFGFRNSGEESALVRHVLVEGL
jgi:hypothetical protein